ncbi:hypothetical protein C8J57DRAFT_1524245 [Mycena rebaudengoi]|nr:hypothetical protein C8J57DRAFT_1524245 [Mycena rebaudengoi]
MAEDSDPLRDNNRDGYRNPPSTPRAVPPPPNPFFMPAPMPFYHSPATPGPGSFIFSPQPYPYLVSGSSYPPPLAPVPGPAFQTPPLTEAAKQVGLPPMAVATALRHPSTGCRTSPRRQKRIFQWPIDVVTTEDRLLVVIRAIRKAGFPTIGSFLAAFFERKYNKNSSVSSSIASFLRGAEDDPTHHPVAIVNLIFHHVKSQRWTAGIAEEPSFSLPRHALRPSLRLDSNLIGPSISFWCARIQSQIDFWILCTDLLATRKPSVVNGLLTRSRTKTSSATERSPTPPSPSTPSSPSPSSRRPPTPPSRTRTETLTPPPAPPLRRAIVDSDSDSSPARIVVPPYSTAAMSKIATVEATAGKPPTLHEGDCTPAVIRSFELNFSNYCTLKAVDSADQTAVVVGCFRDHRITDWLSIEAERERVLSMDFPTFMKELRDRTLPDDWERTARLKLRGTSHDGQ